MSTDTSKPIRLFDFRLGRVKIWADWSTDGLWWDDIIVGKRYELISLSRAVSTGGIVIYGFIVWRLFVKSAIVRKPTRPA